VAAGPREPRGGVGGEVRPSLVAGVVEEAGRADHVVEVGLVGRR
jgi:hypothetical protein